MAFVAALTSGIASRQLPLPEWVGKYPGDLLWATMIYFGLCALRPNAARYRTVATGLGFCIAIEVVKLYHAPWLDAIRGTLLGRLVFGYAFSWRNLVAYTLGIGLGVMVECRMRDHPS
jgi:hypothetical protein